MASIPYLSNIDLTGNQLLNHVIHNSAAALSSPLSGLNYFNTSVNKWFYYNGLAWIDPLARANHTGTQLASTLSDLAATVQAYRVDQFAAPTSSVSWNSQKITNLADGTGLQDAATINNINNLLQSFAQRLAAAAVTTAPLATNTYSNGASGVGATLTATVNGAIAAVDGYTPALNDYLLIISEVTGSNNGLYKVTQLGDGTHPYILTRALDMNVSANFTGAYFVVGETSTTLGGAIYLCNQPAPTVGTTALTFTRVNAATTYSADEATIHKTGSTFSIISTYVGQSSITTLGTIGTGSWQGTPVALLYGGTGATTAASARANMLATGKYSVTIGNGALTTFTINHNLNTTDVVVSLKDVATSTNQFTSYVGVDANNGTLSFSVAPTTNQYRITVVG